MVLVFGNRVLQHVRWTGKLVYSQLQVGARVLVRKLGAKITVSSCTIVSPIR